MPASPEPHREVAIPLKMLKFIARPEQRNDTYHSQMFY